ncbi:MAG: hypothetical protein CO109_04515 [Deltaproteobacteria bacterium CG_4_9_14_3_um_filter_65_9]|nr:MAG: hypothetical protein CO109_04515 [Deltaproteobacteria bacterium CG_4_9_14_3_um_filter_65_9]
MRTAWTRRSERPNTFRRRASVTSSSSAIRSDFFIVSSVQNRPPRVKFSIPPVDKNPVRGSCRRWRNGGVLKISDRGKWGALLDETRRVVDVLSEGRARRIEEIRSALRDGTYRVDGKQVAGKMVSDAVRELRER